MLITIPTNKDPNNEEITIRGFLPRESIAMVEVVSGPSGHFVLIHLNGTIQPFVSSGLVSSIKVYFSDLPAAEKYIAEIKRAFQLPE
jgi:hypothetical protein